MSIRLLVEGDPGYAVAYDPDLGKESRFYIHRLAAVAEYGFDAVVGMDVNHIDGLTENNSRDNLEPVDPGEHRGQNLHRRRVTAMEKNGYL